MLASTGTISASWVRLGSDMASTPEGKVKKRVRDILDVFCANHAGYYFFPPANGYGRQGIPDVICCIQGRFVAIECKAGKGMTTMLQDRELEHIREAGGLTFLINENNVDTLHAYLILIRGNQL
jgi:hypothetical protein